MREELQLVATSVNDILKDTDLNTIVETVVKRLVSFGYQVMVEDAFLIAFSVKKTVHHVLSQIGYPDVPEPLHEVVVDIVCGEVLNEKFLSGQLERYPSRNHSGTF